MNKINIDKIDPDGTDFRISNRMNENFGVAIVMTKDHCSSNLENTQKTERKTFSSVIRTNWKSQNLLSNYSIM